MAISGWRGVILSFITFGTTCGLVFILATLSPFAHADTAEGLHFSHEDWEVACDNTRTCRAAGYQADSDELAISVLLTRAAGANQSVAGQVMLGNYGEEATKGLPEKFDLTLRINDKTASNIKIDMNFAVAELNPKQVDALLAALVRTSKIEFVYQDRLWRLSGKGAAAVLLKMDDFQGRVGTPGALVRRGKRSEDTVLPALPVPVVNAVYPAKPQASDDTFARENAQALRQAILATWKGNNVDCDKLASSEQVEFNAIRLTGTKMLVSTLCWLGAYNFGNGNWVVNDHPPYDPVLVSGESDMSTDGTITDSHKGRGLGDCWGGDEWTWDGKSFVHTGSHTSGMCRLVAPGGAWNLPTIVTKVLHPPR